MPNKDQVKGRGRELAGKTKTAAGKVTGNEKTEARGRADALRGKTQTNVGNIKEKGKNLVRKLRGR